MVVELGKVAARLNVFAVLKTVDRWPPYRLDAGVFNQSLLHDHFVIAVAVEISYPCFQVGDAC